MKKILLMMIVLCFQISVNGYAFTVNFDYTYDHGGFFSDSSRRAVLNYAASFYTGFTDSLSAITPEGGNTWQARIKNPSPGYDGYAFYTIDDLAIAADTLTIYVGAGSADGFPVLGQASSIGIKSSSGDQQFITDLTTRGQGLTTGAGANDYGALGGSIWFNSDPDWYFGTGDESLSSDHPDFLTTAAHEIGHILGYGTAASWLNLIGENDGLFYGEDSVDVYGGPVPTDGHSHWGEGTMSAYNGSPQETMMDPSTPYGERQYPTTLDMAGLYDIGWEATPVPLPSSLILLLSGLGVIVRRLKA